jgi:hypothetical protein
MDEGLLKLLDQLDSLIKLRETSVSAYAPAAEGRLLDLSINALKMAVQANMEARDKGMAGVPETYRDLVRGLANNPELRPDVLVKMRDNSHVHDRYLRDRARHLMGLSAVNGMTSKGLETSHRRNLPQERLIEGAVQARSGRTASQRKAESEMDRSKPENSKSHQIERDFGAEQD